MMNIINKQCAINKKGLMVTKSYSLWSHKYSWTSVIRPPVIRIPLLSGRDLAMCTVYFDSFHHKILLKTKNHVVKSLLYFILYPFLYTVSNKLDTKYSFYESIHYIIVYTPTELAVFQHNAHIRPNRLSG